MSNKSLFLQHYTVDRIEKLGYPVPKFDFRCPGVTSMSADIHKYGYGVKVIISSVLLVPMAHIRCEINDN